MTDTVQNPHPTPSAPVTGYRVLSEAEVALMNEIKGIGITLGELVAKVRDTGDTDKRWAAIAQTELQQGFMALIRAVAQPTTF